MGTKLFVGNLSFKCGEDDIRDFFESRGFSISSTQIIKDRETGRSRGFAFVEFTDASQVSEAIKATNGQSLDGRQLTINEAKPQDRRDGGGRQARAGSR